MGKKFPKSEEGNGLCRYMKHRGSQIDEPKQMHTYMSIP